VLQPGRHATTQDEALLLLQLHGARVTALLLLVVVDHAAVTRRLGMSAN
jgi:hypothetical protein